MRVLAISAIILVLLGGGGLAAYSYLSEPRVITSTSEPVTLCADADGNDIYERGTTAFSYAGTDSKSTLQDICDYYPEDDFSRAGVLRETYCSNNQLVTEKINCGLGSSCRDGRCVSGGDVAAALCTDTDGGENIQIRGETIMGAGAMDDCYVSSNQSNPEEGGGLTDTCSGRDCYVYEYYCSGDSREYKIIPSPQGCSMGAAR